MAPQCAHPAGFTDRGADHREDYLSGGGVDIDNFNDIRDQILRQCEAVQILLFGSQAKGTAGKGSDIDICVVAPTENKRQLLTELYYSVEADRPIDLVLYTPGEWNACLGDSTSFAHKISTEGIRLYSR